MRFLLWLAAASIVACSSSSTTTPTTTSSSSGNSTSSSGSSGSTSGSTSGAPTGDPTGPTTITGKLGDLGEVGKIVSSLWITNSGESLVYLSTATITCDTLTTSRWLGSTEAGSKTIEIVIKGNPAVGDKAVPPAEVNYAPGGKSSAYEKNAEDGSVSFTKADAKTVQGTVTASYSDGTKIEGTFNATFCTGGQDW